MSKRPPAPPPSPAVPIVPWPYSMTWLGDHLGRDYARFWSRLAGVSDPMEALQAEADLGANVWRDWTDALEQMSMLPMKIWAAAPDAAEKTGRS